jgi:Ca2+-dependent lipid-binding protein
MEGQDLVMPDSSSSNSISSSNHEKNIFCEATMSLQKFSTHALDSSNPKWNTSMQFQIYDLNKDFLSVVVYDRKTFSPNALLGKTELKILQIYKEQMKENQQNNPIIRVFKINNEHHGKLMLKMSISIYK